MTELSAWFAFFPSFPTGELFKQLLAAGVGTAAFSVLFYVPRKYYGFCAACGAWGWLTYFVLEWAGMTVTEATFFAAAAVVFLSRLFAVMERCPATLFMIPGIFPGAWGWDLLDGLLHRDGPDGTGQPYGLFRCQGGGGHRSGDHFCV